MSLTASEVAMRSYRQRSRLESLMALHAHAAAARLSIATRSWATAPPDAIALADAAQTAAELRAIIAEFQMSRALAEPSS